MTTVAALTLAHRRSQIKLSASIIQELVTLWPSFDPLNIDRSWAALERAIMSIIADGRQSSSLLTEAYYRAAREAAGVATRLPLVALGGTTWEPAALTSINVTGPILTKSAIAAKRPVASLAADALVRVSGAATRHALDGGRDTMNRYIKADKVKYRRITSSNPCTFCSLLRDRGAVYLKETSGFRSHDHCSCTAEPVFGKPHERMN
jgi:hypothetical protein